MQIDLDDKECLLILISLGRLHFELTSKDYRMREVIFNEIRKAYSLVDDPEKMALHSNIFSEKIASHMTKCKKEYGETWDQLLDKLNLKKS
jgi:hypothetical protein